MALLTKGRYRARFAQSDADLAAAQRLRYVAFRDAHGGGEDADAFDPSCAHMLVEEIASGSLVCCFRLMLIENGQGLERSYAGQYYELAKLAKFEGPMLEMGRFCVHPDHPDPDILRVAWGALTVHVDAIGAEMLFGCASFEGTCAEAYLDAFSLLKDRHLAPTRWLPRVKAPSVSNPLRSGSCCM